MSGHIFEHQYYVRLYRRDSDDQLATVATAENALVGIAAFEEAAKHYSHTVVRLLNGARVMREVVTGRYDPATQTIEIVERR